MAVSNGILWDADDESVVAGEISLHPLMTLTCPTANRSSRSGVATVNIGLGVDAARAYSEDGVAFGLLIERPIVNRVNDQDFGSWITVSDPVVTTGITDPATGSDAVRVEDDDAASGNVEYIRQNLPGTILATTDYASSVWLKKLDTAGTSTRFAFVYDPDVGPIQFSGPLVVIAAQQLTWSYQSDVSQFSAGAGSDLRARLIPAIDTANVGEMEAWGCQLELGAYSSSFMGSDNATFDRAAEKLSWPSAEIAPAGFFDVTVRFRPRFDETQTFGDLDVAHFSPTSFAQFRKSDQKVILSLDGEVIESSAITFLQSQELSIRVVHSATGRQLIVSGATTGNGTTTGAAVDPIVLPANVFLFGNKNGATEHVDLRFFSATPQSFDSGLIAQFTDPERRLSRFIERWSNLPNLDALTRIYLRQIQDVEDVLFEIMLERDLDNAVGVQLTILGNIVGQPRTTLDDNRFRTAIRARIAINLSDSTAEDIIGIANLILVDGESYFLRDEPPAQLRVTVLDPLTSSDADLMRDLLELADAAGVRLLFQFNDSLATAADKLLLGDTVSGSSPGGGLGSTTAGGGTGKIDSVFGPE